jgi:hypothetical protein
LERNKRYDKNKNNFVFHNLLSISFTNLIPSSQKKQNFFNSKKISIATTGIVQHKLFTYGTKPAFLKTLFYQKSNMPVACLK